MLKKIDKIQELLNVPNVDVSTETAITNMKILNLLVDLRAEAKKLILSGVIVPFVCDNCQSKEFKQLTRSTSQCKKCDHLQAN
jgi:hypothetical protein